MGPSGFAAESITYPSSIVAITADYIAWQRRSAPA
jgi:hypothetical protein